MGKTCRWEDKIGAVGDAGNSQSVGVVPTMELAETTRTHQDRAVSALEVEACSHCGLPCGESALFRGDWCFCCAGCQVVFELLREEGLDEFYRLGGLREFVGVGQRSRGGSLLSTLRRCGLLWWIIPMNDGLG